MFGKKKIEGVPVQHYEGLSDFPQDYPCRIEMKESVFEIRRKSPEITVTLPINRIKMFQAMEEKNFMLKYHSQAVTTTKTKNIQKYYLVVNFIAQDDTDKFIAFWGTALEYQYFLDLQYKSTLSTPTSYTL